MVLISSKISTNTDDVIQGKGACGVKSWVVMRLITSDDEDVVKNHGREVDDVQYLDHPGGAHVVSRLRTIMVARFERQRDCQSKL